MSMNIDTIIKGGKIVTADGTFLADIAVRGEKIVAIGQGLVESIAHVGKRPEKGKNGARSAHVEYGVKVIDALGRYVIPGGIDVHVHLALPFCGTTSADD